MKIILKYLFLHIYFIVLYVVLYFGESGFFFQLFEKGLILLPNFMLVVFMIMELTEGSNVKFEMVTNPKYVSFEKEGIDILAQAARGEVIDLVERPGTKVAIGLTKTKKPRKVELGTQNKNVLV